MWSPLARKPSLTMSSALHSGKSDTEAKRLSDTDSSQTSTQEASKESAASGTDKREKPANRQTAACEWEAAVVRRAPERHAVLITPPGNSLRFPFPPPFHHYFCICRFNLSAAPWVCAGFISDALWKQQG